MSLCSCLVSKTCGLMSTSNQFCWSLLVDYWNKSSNQTPAAVFLMFFLECFSPSICHTAWLWCHDCAFSLAGLCSPAVLERYNWTVGFERERKISGDSSLAAMLLYNFFTSNDFNQSKVPWNRTKKAKNMRLYPKEGKYVFFVCVYDHISFTFYTS